MSGSDQDSNPKGGHLLRRGDHRRKFLSAEMDDLRGQGRRILPKTPSSIIIPPAGGGGAAVSKGDRKRARHEEQEEKKRAKREEKEREVAEKARAKKDTEERERFKKSELKKREKLEKQINAASETTKRLKFDLDALKSSSSATIRDHADKIKERDVEIQCLNKTILRLQQCVSTPNPKSNSQPISCSSASPPDDPSILGLLSSLIAQRNHVTAPLSVAPTPLRPAKGGRRSSQTPTPSANAQAPAPAPAHAPAPAPSAPTRESLEEALRRMMGAPAPAPAPAPCIASTLANLFAAR